MKIKKVSVNTHDMQLKEPYAIAGHVHESIKNTFIRIEDDDGNTGIGSCATRDDSENCLLYTSPSPRDQRGSRIPASA